MDLESAIDRLVSRLIKRDGFRLPLHVASVAANGAVLFTRYEAAPPGSPPGSVSSEHVTGDVGDEGFGAPIHIMVKGAAGRVHVARHNAAGTTTQFQLVDPNAPSS